MGKGRGCMGIVSTTRDPSSDGVILVIATKGVPASPDVFQKTPAGPMGVHFNEKSPRSENWSS